LKSYNCLFSLWFAFKKLYLWLDKQHETLRQCKANSCDLLSKNCIFDLINNYLKTAPTDKMLWFAFKKLYLWLDKQQKHYNLLGLLCCDLLSKNCIFDLINNRPSQRTNSSYSCDLLSKNCIFDLINNTSNQPCSGDLVVICFQKIVSLTW